MWPTTIIAAAVPGVGLQSLIRHSKFIYFLASLPILTQAVDFGAENMH